MGYVVFSDVGGTLFEGTPWNMIRRHPAYNKARGTQEFVKFMPVYVLNKVRILSEAAMRRQWLAHMAATFTGIPRDTIDSIYRDIIHGEMQPLLRRDVIASLLQHKRQGATVMLVSGIFTDMVQLIAEHIGIDGAIGTQVEYIDNVATGRLAGNPCVGQNKIDYIKQYINTHHPQVDLQDCYGYADSYSDRALLSIVGHGVVTYPDVQMRQIAVEHGWDIIPA